MAPDTVGNLPTPHFMRLTYGRAKAVARAARQLGLGLALDLRPRVAQLWRQSQLLLRPT
jgi:hypothetical protein